MIRDATSDDLPTIIEIYNASIPGRMATADLETVTVASRREWFATHTVERRPLWVLEVDDRVVAWLSFRSFYGREAYRHTAELSVYVAPADRRRQLGNRLLIRAVETAHRLDLTTLIAFIFAHNSPSLNLFTKHQFQQWGYLPRIAELDGIDRDLVILGRRILTDCGNENSVDRQ